MSRLEDVTLANLGRFSSGKPIAPGSEGPYKAFGSNGVIGGSSDSRHDRGIIVGRVGAYCGSIAVSRDPFWASDNTIVIEPIVDEDLDYIYYLLRSANLHRHAGGSAQPLLTQATLKALQFPVPEPSLRIHIGKLLRSFDDLMETNRRRATVLEKMAGAIYREWFVKFRYPGHEGVPLVDSALGLVPKGWGIEPFDDVASFLNGFAFKPSHWGAEGRPIIKIKELKAGVSAGTPRCSEDAVDKRYWVEGGDLLMSWSADLGIYLWGDEAGLLNQHLFVVRPTKDSVTLLYLLHALDSAMPDFRARAQGTTMKHIKRAALHEVPVLIPLPSLLADFDRAVEPIHSQSLTLQAQTRKLSAMRDLLLPKLVSGKIDVSTLDLGALVEDQAA